MSKRDQVVDVLVVGAGSAGATRGDRRGAGRCANAARRPARLPRRHVDERARHLLRVLHAGLESPDKVVGGIPDEVVAGLRAEDACFERPNTYGAGTGVTYDPETLKRVWEALADRRRRAAAAAHFAFATGVRRRRPPRRGAGRRTKGGERWVVARVPSSTPVGDADLCHLAGAPYDAPDDRHVSRSRPCSGSPTWTSTARWRRRQTLWRADARGGRRRRVPAAAAGRLDRTARRRRASSCA